MSHVSALKAIVRGLPFDLQEKDFLADVRIKFANQIDWYHFVPGKEKIRGDKVHCQSAPTDTGSSKESSEKKPSLPTNLARVLYVVPSYCKIAFHALEALRAFAHEFNGKEFRDGRGNVSRSLVEYAPVQRIPKQCMLQHDLSNTLQSDPDYLEFVNKLEVVKPTPNNVIAWLEEQLRIERRGLTEPSSALLRDLLMPPHRRARTTRCQINETSPPEDMDWSLLDDRVATVVNVRIEETSGTSRRSLTAVATIRTATERDLRRKKKKSPSSNHKRPNLSDATESKEGQWNPVEALDNVPGSCDVGRARPGDAKKVVKPGNYLKAALCRTKKEEAPPLVATGEGGEGNERVNATPDSSKLKDGEEKRDEARIRRRRRPKELIRPPVDDHQSGLCNEHPRRRRRRRGGGERRLEGESVGILDLQNTDLSPLPRSDSKGQKQSQNSYDATTQDPRSNEDANSITNRTHSTKSRRRRRGGRRERQKREAATSEGNPLGNNMGGAPLTVAPAVIRVAQRQSKPVDVPASSSCDSSSHVTCSTEQQTTRGGFTSSSSRDVAKYHSDVSFTPQRTKPVGPIRIAQRALERGNP